MNRRAVAALRFGCLCVCMCRCLAFAGAAVNVLFRVGRSVWCSRFISPHRSATIVSFVIGCRERRFQHIIACFTSVPGVSVPRAMPLCLLFTL